MKRRVVCLSKEYVYLKFMSTYITYPLTILKVYVYQKLYVYLKCMSTYITYTHCMKVENQATQYACISKVYVNLYYMPIKKTEYDE